MHPPADDEDNELRFDDVCAQELIGKYVLVGITVNDKRGDFKRQEQFHGTVTSANEGSGITLTLRGTREGETKVLPPATNVFEPAPRGTYRLRSTGEKVVDPDYTATWLLVQPDA